MALPSGFLSELKMRSDITDVISSYVSLKKRGRNMIGLCPFHSEKTPSFNIFKYSSALSISPFLLFIFANSSKTI